MVGTGLGMVPLAFAQAYLSVGLFTLFPWLIWPLVVGCVIYLVVAVVIVIRLSRPRRTPDTTANSAVEP
jgi:membrane protein implicated in regulation of membrane protease activity